MSTLTPVLRLSAVAVLLCALVLSPIQAPSVNADPNPCQSAQGSPGDPDPGIDPDIAGILTDANSQEPIYGATLRLYLCVAGAGSQVGYTTTDSQGYYEFGGLAQGFYYVTAADTGPLSGMTPASGTVNPSALIPFGAGDLNVDFSFE